MSGSSQAIGLGTEFGFRGCFTIILFLKGRGDTIKELKGVRVSMVFIFHNYKRASLTLT